MQLNQERFNMLEKKKIQSLRTRIRKEKSNFGCMGGMILEYEILAMEQAERIQLQQALISSRNPLTYDKLNEAIEKNLSPFN